MTINTVISVHDFPAVCCNRKKNSFLQIATVAKKQSIQKYTIYSRDHTSKFIATKQDVRAAECTAAAPYEPCVNTNLMKLQRQALVRIYSPHGKLPQSRSSLKSPRLQYSLRPHDKGGLRAYDWLFRKHVVKGNSRALPVILVCITFHLIPP